MSAFSQRPLLFGSVLLCAALTISCSSKRYKELADKETAGVIAEKSRFVPNMDTNFTVVPAPAVALDHLPTSSKVEDFLGKDAAIEKDAHVITLQEALSLAVKHSRSYQNEKEALFLSALALTLDRHKFAPLFSGKGSTRQNYNTDRDVVGGVNRVVETETYTGSQRAGVKRLSRLGTSLATSFSTDFLRFIVGDPRLTTSSALVGTLSQPLLRGAGSRIATEVLTQSERDLLYDFREFTRFRKEFAVRIASSYYNVLQNRDAVQNSWRGYQNFLQTVARETAFYEEGERAQAQLNQLKQALLSTESRWINAVRVYRQNLDEFKIELGLPVEANIVLDDSELRNLQIADPNLTLDQALEIALISRLDLETERDQLIDAERHIKVAKNGFLPQLDVVGETAVSGNGRGGFASPSWNRYDWNAGLDVDLPFDRKSERNTYRASFIRFERAKRDLELAVDNVRLQLKEDWRSLEQAQRNYEISKLGVEIAESRVEEQRLRQDIGEATARDIIDAENDLIDSQNQLTSALVSHTVARLQFWRDIGIMTINDTGEWQDVEAPEVVMEKENEYRDD